MNNRTIINFIEETWNQSVIPTLIEYIKIPNKSPTFDPYWESNSFMNQAVILFADWAKTHGPSNLRLEIIKTEGRTPLLFMEIPGHGDETVILYGHLDKQPEMTGWDEEFGPWKPVLHGDKLYGRGAADDGYAMFCALTAIKTLQQQKIPHHHCFVLIEACEESGSNDLPFYLEQLQHRFQKPTLVIGLDSGCGNYDQLWGTTSLRGIINGNLSIEVLSEGVHSGNASGIVPSPFRIARQLLSRIEDQMTGQICVDELQVNIPALRVAQAKQSAEVLNKNVFADFPFLGGVQPAQEELVELILNRTWRPALTIIGADGLPLCLNAGNVLLPKLVLKLSLRLPPTCNHLQAAKKVSEILLQNPPYQAQIQFDIEDISPGWHAPPPARWFEIAVDEASQCYFGKPAAYMGEGGSIPFMGMLGKQYPQAQFLITGVLGPHANAHGPNEFLHIPTAKKLTACVAHVLAKHFEG